MTVFRIAVVGALGAAIAGMSPAAAQQPIQLRRPVMPIAPMAQSGPPDLIVENVREEGGAILADVRNAGPGDAGPTKIAIYARGGGRVEQDFAGLRAGTARTVRFDRPEGASAVQVMIDPANAIVEANEGNNRPAALALGAPAVAAGDPGTSRSPPIGRDPAAGRPPVFVGRDTGTGRPPNMIGRRPPPVDAPPVATPPVGANPTPVGRRFAEIDSGPIDEIVPPGVNVVARRGQVTLRPAGFRATMQTMQPVRAPLTVANLRANPVQKLGRTTVDFRPFLNNPQALVNVAQRLRQSGLADVRVDKLEAIEVRQGLVIRSFLNYNLRPGACRDSTRRGQVARTGIRCATQMSPAARAAAFANPNDPRFVADPGQRAIKLKEAAAEAAKLDAETALAVTAFKAQLADPAAKAELVAGLGAQAVQELTALDDTALAGELVNSGDTKVEQVAFIPTEDEAEKTPPKKKLSQPPPLELPKPYEEEFDMGSHVFLTGFTLGREHEWKQRVEKSIKWCLVGCKKTYYAEVYAGFKYGFGLRFPIRWDGKVKFKRDNGKDTAVMRGNMTPFNGESADYVAAGLPSYQVFGGKELVAEMGAHAGFGVNVPFYPKLAVDFAVEKDFTEGLPPPITNGQFTPPAPGAPMVVEVPFPDLDLIGGRANFGAFGAKVFPAVKVTVGAEKLRFNVVDQNGGGTIEYATSGSELTLRTNPQNSSIAFRVEDPLYTLSFGVEPGIVARLFIDLGVWGNSWDWPVWFPQLKMTLPPGGLSFSCHDGTTCSRSFRFEPAVKTSALDDKVQIWAVGFEQKWLPQCFDEICQFGVRFVRLGTALNARQNLSTLANPSQLAYELGVLYKQADKDAGTIVLEAQARKAQSTSNAWGQLAQAIWTKQCADKRCYDDVSVIAAGMGPRAAELRKAYPEESDLKVQGMVNKEAGPKFKAAVEASKLRVASNALMKGLNANPLPKQNLPPIK